MDRIDEELRQIRALLAEMRKETGSPPPIAVGYEKAATMLDVSLSTVKRLVLRGDLVPIRLMGRKLLSISEINRMMKQMEEERRRELALPVSAATRPEKQTRRPQSKTYSGKAAAEAIRAANKRPR